MKTKDVAKRAIILVTMPLLMLFCSCSSRWHLKRALAKEPEIFTEKITLASKIQAVEVPLPEVNISAIAPVIEGESYVTVTENGDEITQTFLKDKKGNLLAETKVKIKADTVKVDHNVSVVEIKPIDIVDASKKPGFKRYHCLLIIAAIIIWILFLQLSNKNKSR